MTTKTDNPSKITAQSLAGAVEVYVPKTVCISGRATTNFGKLNIGMIDASKIEQQEQFLMKTVRFDKILEGANKLFIEAESKTGSVIVCYTAGDTELAE